MKVILRGFRIHAIHHSWRLSRASLPACQSACQPASQPAYPTSCYAFLLCIHGLSKWKNYVSSWLSCPSVCLSDFFQRVSLSVHGSVKRVEDFLQVFFFLSRCLSLSLNFKAYFSVWNISSAGKKKGREREGGWSETGGGNTRNCRLYELAEKRPPSQWSQVFFCSSNTFSNLSAKIAKTRRGVETKKKIEKGPT